MNSLELVVLGFSLLCTPLCRPPPSTESLNAGDSESSRGLFVLNTITD